MSLAPFKPFDTVLTETPSLVAISLIVAMGKILSLVKTVDFFILYKENKKLTSRHTKFSKLSSCFVVKINKNDIAKTANMAKTLLKVANSLTKTFQ